MHNKIAITFFTRFRTFFKKLNALNAFKEAYMWYLRIFASSTGWGNVIAKALSMNAHLRHRTVVPLELKFY
jgi:hypothetical protein